MSERWARGVVFAALILAFPWPWYLIAVGGLLPVPLILAMASDLSQPVVSALLALSAALGVAAFWFAARVVRRFTRRARPWAVAGAVGLLVFLAQLPIYGGGENLASPAGKFAGAYDAYARQFRPTSPR